jgi:hypothetical protein
MSRAFEIAVTTKLKRPQHTPLPLFWLPEAAQQQGSVVARCRRQNSLWLEPVRLDPIPLPAGASVADRREDAAPVCAAYRYQPADCRDAMRMPKLLASEAADAQSNPITARHIQLESYFWADGTATHRATYALENRGASEMRLSLPEDATLVSATAAGQSLEVTAATGINRPIVVRLPSNSGSIDISLSFETRGAALAAGRELRSPLAVDDVPFLGGEWIVWLPEEFSASGSGLSPASQGFNWRKRIFGPLGRPAGEQPFNPLQLDGGTAATNEPGDANAPEVSKSPLTVVVSSNSTSTGSKTPGWQKYQESFVANGPAPIVVLHPPAMTAWSVVFLIAAFLCGRALQKRQREAYAVVLAIVAGASLFLPPTYADLAAGAFLGLLFSLVAEWLRPTIGQDQYVPSPRARFAIASTLVLLLVIGLAKLSWAESPKADVVAKNGPDNTYRVLIPTDADGQPSGSKYFVSERFLRILLATDSKSDSSSNQWLLRDAVYSGELREASGSKETAVGTWAMTFSVETLGRDSTLFLPLVRDEAAWDATAMLDGVPLPLEWRNGGRQCAIKIAEPGRYSLALACVPKSTISADRSRISLSIPPIPGARVELRYPESTAGVIMPALSSEPVAAAGGKSLSALLDIRDRLQVEWSRSDATDSGKSGFSLTELRWIDVKSAEIGLRVKYVLEGVRRPEAFTVAYDDRWKLSADKKSAIVEQGKATVPGRRLIRVPVSVQSTDRQEVLLNFQLRNPPELGNLRLPPVELTTVPASKRWLAVSADASLDCGVVDSSAIDGTVNEFFAKWGDATDEFTPELVLSNFDVSRPLTLAIRPRRTAGELRSSSYAAELWRLQIRARGPCKSIDYGYHGGRCRSGSAALEPDGKKPGECVL